MNKQLLSFIAAMTLSFCVEADIYKWVDADGKTHYTQTPPPTEEDQARPSTAMKINGAGSGSDVSVSRKRGAEFCGSIRLYDTEDKAILLANIRANMEFIIENKNRAAKRYSDALARQLSSNNRELPKRTVYAISEEVRKAKQSLGELTCQLKWAQRKLKELDSFRQAYVDDYERTKREYDKLVALREARCKIKVLDENRRVDPQLAKKRHACYAYYDPKIKALKKSLRKRSGLKDSLD